MQQKPQIYGLCFLLGASMAGCPPIPPTDLPPVVTLHVDPSYGEPPLEVVCKADAMDPDGDSLTYAWDFADGAGGPGKSSMLHTYTQLGTYSIQVSVSDGGHTTSASAMVRLNDYPGETREIGPEGGEFSPEEGIFSCKFAVMTVPPGAAPQSTVFGLAEWPSLAAIDGKQLDASRIQLVGAAYRIDMPLKTASPIRITIGYDETIIPAGRLAENLIAVQRLVALEECFEGGESGADRPLLADYVPLATVVDTEAGTVQFDLYAGAIVQLAALTEPLQTFTFDAASAEEKQESALPVTVVFSDPPDNPEMVVAAIREGVQQAYQVLAFERGFRTPEMPLDVIIGEVGEHAWGYAYLTDCRTLCLSRELAGADEIKKFVAHLYFHTIQNFANNHRSKIDHYVENQWFTEGTACWAMDEVFDALPGRYHATQPRRFRIPLNVADYDGSVEYQTVGFWMWAEEEQPGVIRGILNTQSGIAHDLDYGTTLTESAAATSFQDILTEFWPNVDFTDFAGAALFRKSFEFDETQAGDLWSAQALGLPGVYPADAEHTYSLQPGMPGDSSQNRLSIAYEVSAPLTVDWFLLSAGPGAASEGTLHVVFEQQTSGTALDALIYASQLGDIAPVAGLRDLTQPHPEVTAWFGPGVIVCILVADPHWSLSTGDGANAGRFEVWIEPISGR